LARPYYEYGQLNALIEQIGGPKVVVNFLFVNVAFQLGRVVEAQPVEPVLEPVETRVEL
jgi:hypothetical protein